MDLNKWALRQNKLLTFKRKISFLRKSFEKSERATDTLHKHIGQGRTEEGNFLVSDRWIIKNSYLSIEDYVKNKNLKTKNSFLTLIEKSIHKLTLDEFGKIKSSPVIFHSECASKNGLKADNNTSGWVATSPNVQIIWSVIMKNWTSWVII